MLAAARAVGADGRRAVRARDDGRDERAARTARRAHGVRLERGLRASPAPAPPDARAPLPAVRRASRAARPARALSRRARAGSAPTASSSRSTSRRCPTSATRRRSPSACSSRSATRRTSARSRDELRRAAPRRARRRLARGRAGVPRVRARVDDGRRRVPRARRGALPARARDAARARRDCRSRSSCSRRAASRRSTRRRRIRRRSSSPGRPAASSARGSLARRAGFENAIAFDMGGTSTDVCLLPGGRAARVAEREVGGLPIRLPTVDLHTVGAGGGSLVRRRRGRRDPRRPRESAGAHPGPGVLRPRRRRDGHRREPPARPAAGGAARRARARPRRGRSARSTGSTRRRSIDVVNAEMLRALRVVSVERGHDPRDFALVAFGGAGPLHACALAEELGIEAVLVPAAAGVLSALGPRRERRATRPRRVVRVRARRRGRAAGRRRGRPPLPRASRSS